MASSTERAPSRRQSTANLQVHRNNGDELSSSMDQLSLSTATVATDRNAPRSPSALSPFRTGSRHASPSPAMRRAPSRSPSTGLESPSRASTPALNRKTSTSSLRSVNGRAPSLPPPASRRSSIAHASSPAQSRTSLAVAVPEEPAVFHRTANSVAQEYFKAELAALHGPTSDRQTDALVVLHDDCFGHRFSRPKTSRAALSTIVERPERIKASVLGVAMAYVRLGDRHCEGAYPIHPSLEPDSIPTVPFLIHKTKRKVPLTAPAVTNVHGTKWMEELKIMCDTAESKLAMGGKELQRPNLDRGPDSRSPPKFHEGDLYLCAESLDALEGALGAVCEAVDRVFTIGPRRAFVAVRPPGHHCSASYPSGFCWVNNVHVGIMHGVMTQGLTHAAIIDFDLHHGDGSQAITWQHNSRATTAPKNAAAWKKASIGYFSLHDINSYPCEMGDEEKVKNASLCIENAHGQNVWNVHLQSWTSEHEFWELYQSKYSNLLEKTRSYLRQQAERLQAAGQEPKACIFFSAGFDASEWETKGMQRHNVNVPTEFYARITQDVVKIAAEEGLAVEGRVISVLEGGYSDRALYSGIFSHLSGMVGEQSTAQSSYGRGGLARDMMGQSIDTMQATELGVSKESALSSIHTYDKSWWSSHELDSFEMAMSGPPPEPPKQRQGGPSTYYSPTHASTAKMASPSRTRRSTPSLTASNSAIVRTPTPPPPEVPWTIAAHELGKLLIPSDRQTDSCKAEDLNAEATRARRDRQSLLNPVVVPTLSTGGHPDRPTSRMSLRERKPAQPSYQEGQEGGRKDKDKNRRKTVAGPSALQTDKTATSTSVSHSIEATAPKRSGRRLSGVSSVVSTPARKPMNRTASGTSLPPAESVDVKPNSDAGISKSNPNALQVTKTRVPQTARAAPARAQRGGKKTTGPAKATPPAPITSSQTEDQDHKVSVDAGLDDLDDITAGMRKIRINLITKAQKEERDKASLTKKVEGSKSKEGLQETGSISSVPKAETSPPPDRNMAQGNPNMQGAVVNESSGLTSLTLSPSVSSHIQDSAQERTALQILQNRPQAATLTPLANADTDVFVAYQPEGPAPVPVPQQESLRWLPPNMASPIAVRRDELPTFTATSAIRFGARENVPQYNPRSGSREQAAGPLASSSDRKAEPPAPPLKQPEN